MHEQMIQTSRANAVQIARQHIQQGWRLIRDEAHAQVLTNGQTVLYIFF